MVLPKTAGMPEMELEWKVPEKSNAIERDRARTYHQAYSALVGLHCLEQALDEIRAGRTKSWSDFKVPDEAVSVGFHEAARGVLSHHMVIRDGKIANYQPYPPTPWNANPRDVYGTPGPYEDAVQNTPIFEENGPENFKGVDIMRAVRSFDPCLPCGVHMYTGAGRVQEGGAPADRPVLRPPPVDSERHLARVQELTEALEALPDGHADGRSPRTSSARSWSSTATGCGGSSRRSTRPAPAGQEIHERLVEDGVVASLLLIHDLYPVDLETRVREALATVRPYMESHGGDVELLGIEDGVARLRLEGHCKGCPASAATLELAIKQALDEAAPDLAGLEVEGVVAGPQASAGRRPGCCQIQLPTATGRRADADLDGARRGRRRLARRAAHGHAARRRARRGQRRRHAAGLPQRVRRVRRPASTTRR